MRLKGITIVLALAAASSLHGLEEEIRLVPGQAPFHLPAPGSTLPGATPPQGVASSPVRDPILGAWVVDNAVTQPGWRGGLDYVLAPAAYRLDPGTDLLLHFDDEAPKDEAGRWLVEAGPTYRRASSGIIGTGAASFTRPGSAISLRPGRGALLEKSSRFRDFSVEFWVKPATVENGEVLLSWRSTLALPGGLRSQALSCAVAAGRLSWTFQGFFETPARAGSSPAEAGGRVELRGRRPLVPKSWSHHLLRFDGDTGLLEYLVDGQTEATLYLTTTGREGGTVMEPFIGAASPLVLGESFLGQVDEFRLTRSFVDKPELSSYGRDPGFLLSPVVDLGIGHSRLKQVDLQARTPGATGIELAYRISDDWVGWNLESPEWQPLRPGQALPATALGRYVQVKAILYPDGTGKATPSLSALTLRYEADPLPPPPAKVVAQAKDGAIQLSWSRVPEADVAGYLIYYGSAPGEYFGSTALEGQSPLDVGNVLSYTLTGLPNGGLVYLVVAAYDTAATAAGASPAGRAGEYSAEVTARPLRTLR